MAQEQRAADDPTTPVDASCPVAETMRRVHAELARGTVRSFEALLAYGVPASTRGS